MKDETIYQLALTRVKGLGPVRQRKLIEYFGTASAVFNAKAKEFQHIDGFGQLAYRALKLFVDFEQIERELERMAQKNVNFHFYTDSSFPNRLRYCDDAPIHLFSAGNVDFNTQKFVAIVGTRRATAYGKRMVEAILEGLIGSGITVVSGLAIGIDIFAHRAALKHQFQNIAVLAHGLDMIYPQSHRETAKQIIRHGAIVSEYPIGKMPEREYFPERNRIIAGLADTTIVVESKLQGGAMITAEIADSYHRDVFAVPGKIEDPMSAGCNYLIKRGKAHLIEDANDLLKIMNWKDNPSKRRQTPQRKLFVDISPRDEKILAFLREKGSCHSEEIAAFMQLNLSQLALHLLELEMNGLVRAHPGSLYSLY